MVRIELAGSLIRPKPLVFRYTANDTFYPGNYTSLDYTHYDVICIGGGGGPGGGITGTTGTLISIHGGAGGGGGYHRVHGLLSALGSACAVVVGQGGAVGTQHASNPAATTDGGDGGASTFAGTVCQASGGKGGKRVQSISGAAIADGGEGGVGNRNIAGGGAVGGVNPGPGVTGTPGGDGTFFGDVGKGGGGGAGGSADYNGTLHFLGTAGGRGSYNPSNLSVYAPGDLPDADSQAGNQKIWPGGAGGAKTSPLTGLPTLYGGSQGIFAAGFAGVVIIRLTGE